MIGEQVVIIIMNSTSYYRVTYKPSLLTYTTTDAFIKENRRRKDYDKGTTTMKGAKQKRKKKNPNT